MVYAPNFCMPEYVVQRVIFHSIICRLADFRLGKNPNFGLSFLLILKNGRERKCLVVKRSKYSKATHKILLLGQLHGKVLTHVFLEGATIIGRQDAPLRNEGALRLAKFDPCGAERRRALPSVCMHYAGQTKSGATFSKQPTQFWLSSSYPWLLSIFGS